VEDKDFDVIRAMMRVKQDQSNWFKTSHSSCAQARMRLQIEGNWKNRNSRN